MTVSALTITKARRHSGPPAGQPSPKPTICGAQSWSFHGTLQHVQLMPKCQDFTLKGGAAPKRANQEGKQRGENGHRRERSLCSQAPIINQISLYGMDSFYRRRDQWLQVSEP